MKNAKILCMMGLLISLSAMVYSQNSADSLYLKRNVLNEWRFYQNGKSLSFKEVKKLCLNKAAAKEPIHNIQRIRWLKYPRAIITGASLGLGIQIFTQNPKASIVSYLLFTSGILGVVNTIHDQKNLDKEKTLLVRAYNESK
jgi:hypothetical protein